MFSLSWCLCFRFQSPQPFQLITCQCWFRRYWCFLFLASLRYILVLYFRKTPYLCLPICFEHGKKTTHLFFLLLPLLMNFFVRFSFLRVCVVLFSLQHLRRSSTHLIESFILAILHFRMKQRYALQTLQYKHLSTDLSMYLWIFTLVRGSPFRPTFLKTSYHLSTVQDYQLAYSFILFV
jgi:hypothetical protein